ncbi:MAG TPA: isoamylase early set domain-containing protein [Gemmatimonadaceae bacterium]|nr:isoamylase early set domain-containing protein [Gemmatimonadaceae bacterium]
MTDDLNSLDPYVQWIVAEARRPVYMDASGEARQRLLEALRAEPQPKRERFAWLLEPRVALRPLVATAMAAGLVGIGLIGGLLIHRDGRQVDEPSAHVASSQLPGSIAPRAVKFVLIAPKAARVSVVGDFNGWDSSATPMTTQGGGADGTWTVFVPMQPGLHTYSFVIDGTHFVTDPSAPQTPDDGYGHRSSVVLVGGSSS